METKTSHSSQDFTFAKEVQAGLMSTPKYLPSKYFYDDQGSRLFQQIMYLPEYYLTRAEYEIFDTQKKAIYEIIASFNRPFDLIELGAGDGLKVKLLLKYFSERKADFTYQPIDISTEALKQLIQNIQPELPKLQINPIEGTYQEALQHIANSVSKSRLRIFLFLGSNIGNLNKEESIKLLQDIRKAMQPHDLLFLGFDLKKHPQVILNAYNDAAGVTRMFNLNLLRRINNELSGNFDLSRFSHYPTYNPQTGEAKSFLVSEASQEVYLQTLNLSIHFEWGETIHTETSKKYTFKEMNEIATSVGFLFLKDFLDCKGYFTNCLWKAA